MYFKKVIVAAMCGRTVEVSKLVEKKRTKKGLIRVDQMEPLSIGVIETEGSQYDGHIVMRTASTDHFEVINLTNPGPNNCFVRVGCHDAQLTSLLDLKVRLLPPGTRIVLEVVEG